MPLVHSNHLLRSKSSKNKPNGFVIYSLEGQRFFTPKNFHGRFNETLCLLFQHDCHSTGPRCYAISNHVYLIPHDGMCLVFEPALNSLILWIISPLALQWKCSFFFPFRSLKPEQKVIHRCWPYHPALWLLGEFILVIFSCSSMVFCPAWSWSSVHWQIDAVGVK